MMCVATRSKAFSKMSRTSARTFKISTRVSHTSGSQGQPLLLVQTKDNLELLFALQASRGNRSRGRERGDQAFHIAGATRGRHLQAGFLSVRQRVPYMPAGAKHYLDVKVFLRQR